MAKKSNKKSKRHRREVSAERKQKVQVIKKPVKNPYVVFFEKMHNACFRRYIDLTEDNTEQRLIGSCISSRKFGIEERKALSRLIHVCKKCGFLKYNKLSILEKYSNPNVKVINVIVNLAKEYGRWINKPEDFKPTVRVPLMDNLYNLIRFLTIKYEVPFFLNKVWDYYGIEDKEYRTMKEWFYNLGFGENIRKQKNLPINLTKKMAHCLNSVPRSFSPREGFRWAQLKGIGFEPRVISGIMSLPLKDDFKNDEFWLTVFHFFANNPFLSSHKYREIYDYIHNIKFRINSEQPNFSIKGRNPNVLMKRVEEWHQEINEMRIVRNNVPSIWEPSQVDPYIQKNKNNEIRIIELSSSEDLYKEGKEMHHCVSSYAYFCSEGRTSIFSLRVYKKDELIETLATIELSRSQNEVVQARGVCNQRLSNEQTRHIYKWAKQNGLKVSSHIKIN